MSSYSSSEEHSGSPPPVMEGIETDKAPTPLSPLPVDEVGQHHATTPTDALLAQFQEEAEKQMIAV